MSEKLLITREVAELLACSDQTIRNLADKGILPCIRLRPPDRGGYRFRPEDVEAFIRNYGETHPKEPAA